MSFIRKTIAMILYILPALAVLCLILSSYYDRTQETATEIKKVAIFVQDNPAPIQDKQPTPATEKEDQVLSRLEHYFRKQKQQNHLTDAINNIDARTRRIWFLYSSLVSIMTLLPFLLLGTRLAYDKSIQIEARERMKYAWKHWAMKFIVSGVIAVGWLYTFNSSGQKAGLILDYLNTADVIKANSLPLYIVAGSVSHVIAAFLGWYLHFLTYMMAKLYHNDVLGSRVYRFLFGKLLFAYGAALILSTISGEGKEALGGPGSLLLVFLIGYFPLSALSILKEVTVKVAQGVAAEKSSLSELPGISRWQILRLEEEGIDSLSTLANYKRDLLQQWLPTVMWPLVVFWIDIAQLYTIIGQERYVEVKDICQTASSFVEQAARPEFQAKVKEKGLENAEEVGLLLTRTFKERLL